MFAGSVAVTCNAALKSACDMDFVTATRLFLTTPRGAHSIQPQTIANGAGTTYLSIWATVNLMSCRGRYSMQRDRFNPAQAQEVAAAFAAYQVDYMFIGKSGAILLGYPGTT